MSQTAGGFYHGIHHGQLTAALLAPVNAFNWEGEPELYARVAAAIGEDVLGKSAAEAAKQGVRAVARLVSDTGIPTIRNLGIKEDDIPELAALAFHDSQTPGNPRDITAQDYERIYRAAYAVQPGEVFTRDRY
jgi:alcohol dehydrogenase class IV